MPASLPFAQVDVFAEHPYQGNPLAVVSAAEQLTEQQMQAFASWTQLSETTFLLPPTQPGAHYRVRIFTPLRELPFAGHPTQGSCQVWLDQHPGCIDAEIVQECAAGLVRIRRQDQRLAFAAPPLLRSGAVDDDIQQRIIRALALTPRQIRAVNWVDNGPGWVGVLLDSHDVLMAIRPDYQALAPLNVGLIAPSPEAGVDVEVRALMGEEGSEDPVTGSLNASLAQWLIPAQILPPRYTASQGTALGRRGRVYVEQVGADIWIGGEVQQGVVGKVAL